MGMGGSGHKEKANVFLIRSRYRTSGLAVIASLVSFLERPSSVLPSASMYPADRCINTPRPRASCVDLSPDFLVTVHPLAVFCQPVPSDPRLNLADAVFQGNCRGPTKCFTRE